MGRRLAVGVGVALGTTLLVAGVTSAGLVGLHGTPPRDVVVTSTPTAPPPSAAPARPASSPAAADPVPAEVVLAEQLLDPVVVPVRSVDRVAVLVQAYDHASGPVVFAFDATAAQWVRLELPGDADPLALRVSPDGRAVLRQRLTPELLVTVEVVELAGGTAHPVSVPVPQGRVADDCSVETTWASTGRIGVVSGCLVPATGPGPGPAYVGMDTWVHEIDLATGGARVVEHVPASAPLENNPAYSPDGRFLAYGIGYGVAEGEDEEWETLRIVQVDGSGTAKEQDMTRAVGGDPWAGAHRVLGWTWPDAADAVGSHLLVDARTGGTTPLGVDGFATALGFVGGRLVVDDGPWSPQTAQRTLSAVDLDTGQVQPWLAVPDGVELTAVSVARAVVTP